MHYKIPQNQTIKKDQKKIKYKGYKYCPSSTVDVKKSHVFSGVRRLYLNKGQTQGTKKSYRLKKGFWPYQNLNHNERILSHTTNTQMPSKSTTREKYKITEVRNQSFNVDFKRTNQTPKDTERNELTMRVSTKRGIRLYIKGIGNVYHPEGTFMVVTLQTGKTLEIIQLQPAQNFKKHKRYQGISHRLIQTHTSNNHNKCGKKALKLIENALPLPALHKPSCARIINYWEQLPKK
eukprot:TRINITY_DN8936_c0_g2_i2.p1 TRINITY_DN8936_c0_g2~~TRINITY_DN8936_c0_g2_i2.p1  ORF type:complete len:235 (+),score=-6.11 TRINITY_DN8936_c0_g2_i2:134-838(+)